MEAVHMNYESLNKVVMTVDCTEQSRSRSNVYSITKRVVREENGFMGEAVQMKIFVAGVFVTAPFLLPPL